LHAVGLAHEEFEAVHGVERLEARARSRRVPPCAITWKTSMPIAKLREMTSTSRL
jgi:hypothetical protein